MLGDGRASWIWFAGRQSKKRSKESAAMRAAPVWMRITWAPRSNPARLIRLAEAKTKMFQSGRDRARQNHYLYLWRYIWPIKQIEWKSGGKCLNWKDWHVSLNTLSVLQSWTLVEIEWNNKNKLILYLFNREDVYLCEFFFVPRSLQAAAAAVAPAVVVCYLMCLWCRWAGDALEANHICTTPTH